MFESAILSLEAPTSIVPSSSTSANATASWGPALWPPVAATAAPPRPTARTSTSAASAGEGRNRASRGMRELPTFGGRQRRRLPRDTDGVEQPYHRNTPPAGPSAKEQVHPREAGSSTAGASVNLLNRVAHLRVRESLRPQFLDQLRLRKGVRVEGALRCHDSLHVPVAACVADGVRRFGL